MSFSLTTQEETFSQISWRWQHYLMECGGRSPELLGRLIARLRPPHILKEHGKHYDELWITHGTHPVFRHQRREAAHLTIRWQFYGFSQTSRSCLHRSTPALEHLAGPPRCPGWLSLNCCLLSLWTRLPTNVHHVLHKTTNRKKETRKKKKEKKKKENNNNKNLNLNIMSNTLSHIHLTEPQALRWNYITCSEHN